MLFERIWSFSWGFYIPYIRFKYRKKQTVADLEKEICLKAKTDARWLAWFSQKHDFLYAYRQKLHSKVFQEYLALKKSLTIQFSKSIFRCNIDYFLDQNNSTNGTLFVLYLYVAFLIIAIFMNVMKERRVAWQVDAPLFFPDEQFTNQPVRYPQP